MEYLNVTWVYMQKMALLYAIARVLSTIWPLMTSRDLWGQNHLSETNHSCNMSIYAENHISECFSLVATYQCDTFGPPKPAPGDIYIYIYIYISPLGRSGDTKP